MVKRVDLPRAKKKAQQVERRGKVPPQESVMEWNDPKDIALVSRTFQTWTDAVIAKDRAGRSAKIHCDDASAT